MNVQELLDNIPTPTAEEMMARRQFARRFTLILLRMGPASREDEAQNERLHLAHLQHLTKLQMAGKLILNGPVMEDHDDILGISIYAAELEDALAMASADPKVQAEYLIVEALPWMAVPNKMLSE